jgi:hypothetical protein
VTGSIVVSRVGNGVAGRSLDGRTPDDSGAADGRHETSGSTTPKAASAMGDATRRICVR